MSRSHERQNTHPLTPKEAEEFLVQFQRNITQATSVEEIDRQAEAFFTGLVPISFDWLANNLKGISANGKALILQYWERLPEEVENEDEISKEMDQDTVLRAEVLMDAPEEERQALFAIMGSLQLMRPLGGSLKDLAPKLFQVED